MAYAIMSAPKTRKFTFWTQPLGPAASALIGSATRLCSGRSRLCTRASTAKMTGPAMLAAASAAITERRSRASSPAGGRLCCSTSRCLLICSSFPLGPTTTGGPRRKDVQELFSRTPYFTPLLLLLTPPVPGHAPRLVHIQDLDHEQHHKAKPGMEEVAPKPVETGTFRLLGYVYQDAHVRHVQKQDDGGKDG